MNGGGVEGSEGPLQELGIVTVQPYQKCRPQSHLGSVLGPRTVLSSNLPCTISMAIPASYVLLRQRA